MERFGASQVTPAVSHFTHKVGIFSYAFPYCEVWMNAAELDMLVLIGRALNLVCSEGKHVTEKKSNLLCTLIIILINIVGEVEESWPTRVCRNASLYS